ncbi:MAG: trehalase-like domain-containing protein, partial [Hyphomicrobium sp.]
MVPPARGTASTTLYNFGNGSHGLVQRSIQQIEGMTLDLALVGNCNIAALIDRNARIVWYCLPRFDGDPVFHQLMGAPSGRHIDGAFSVEMEDLQETE